MVVIDLAANRLLPFYPFKYIKVNTKQKKQVSQTKLVKYLINCGVRFVYRQFYINDLRKTPKKQCQKMTCSPDK